MELRFGFAVVVLGLLGPACTGGTDEGGMPDANDDGMEELLSYEWEVPPGEQYWCVRETLTEDIDLSAFEAIASPGTHHVIVTWGDPDGASGTEDGVRKCWEYDHHFDALLFQTSDQAYRWDFPAGFGHKIPAGMQISLNFHIVNATDDVLTGTTGARILRTDPDTVETWATGMMMGKVSLSVPEGESTQIGHCEMPDDMTIMAVNPHMHSHGVHQKVIAHSSIAGDVVIHDEPFIYESGYKYTDVDPHVPMAKGDIVDVECSYNNDSGGIIPWANNGETGEMCFNMVMVYPAENLLSTPCAD